MGRFIISEEEKNRIRGLYEQKQPQLSPNGQAAFNTIKKAMAGLGTDEQGVLRGVMMIKNQNDYNTALSLTRKEKLNPIALGWFDFDYPKTIMMWISSDMEYDQENQSKDNALLDQMADHLVKFNRNEMSDGNLPPEPEGGER